MRDFMLLRTILDGINSFFLIYLIGYSTFLLITVIVGSVELYTRRQQESMKSSFSRDYFIPISIIIPAYNEEITVVDTVRSLLSLDYRLYEIVIVDDGSKDQTAQKLIDAFSMKQVHRPIRRVVPCRRDQFVYEATVDRISITLVRKENGGKADAINMGINTCRFPWFICMDADSALQRDSLSRIVRPILEQENVVAVGGVVRPSNGVELKNGRIVSYHIPKNLLAAMQVMEYDRSFLASRILFDKFNGSLIISGAFGLFRKDLVIEAGGYDHSTLGEDMELVVKLHEYCLGNNIPYSIRYVPDAVCWSQVPERFRDLCKQRSRWYLGLFQTMWRHKALLSHPSYGVVSVVSYVYFVVYELLSPFFELLGLATTTISYILGLLNPPFMVMLFFIYTVYGSILTLSCFFARIHTGDMRVTFQDSCKALLMSFLEICGLHWLMNYVRITAFWGYRKKKMSWGRIERKKMNVQ